MLAESRDSEIQRLNAIIDNMKTMVSQYELADQNMRKIRNKLDFQIDTFTHIHSYAQQAFQAHTFENLYEIIAEGVVDVFQLEVGGIFALNVSGDGLDYLGGCNLSSFGPLMFSNQWLARQELWSFKHQKALWESPVTEHPFQPYDLAHAIYFPIFCNERKFEGVIIGGVTNQNKDLYEFYPEEIVSPFMVYGRMMNGVFNNMIAIKKATDAGTAKTDFLSNLSHEIRTPMNAVIGMVQIAERSQDINEIHRCLDRISTSSKHLLGLLNDVLDISKIEEGKLVLSDSSFNLKETIDHLLTGIQQTALDKNQSLTVDYKSIHNNYFIGDTLRLAQVLINLLSNAIKFTPQNGSVKLEIEGVSHDKDKTLIRFSVIDTGIGIPESFRKRLFSPFEQSDSSISRKYGGTGLGLAISQRIIQLMGGDIKVESEIGKGSRFYFSIWMTIDNEAKPEEEQVPTTGLDYDEHFDLFGYKILIVDDIDINREIIHSFLEDTGVIVDSATNGQEAVEMFNDSPEGYYDLIFMDVQMPVMDGCTAAKTIRELNRPDARSIAIYALTANVFKEDVQQVIAAGMNGHIAKPVEYESVLNTIRKNAVKHNG